MNNFGKLGIFVVLLVTAGCASGGGQLMSTISAGADRIPTSIGIFPLVSAPRAPMGNRRILFGAEKNKIYISPPAETKLAITPMSQIFTGLITSKLSSHGFNLRELPVEVPDGESNGKHRVFVISLGLLKELHDKYGLEAILLGSVFFNKPGGSLSETRATSMHLKLVDAESLEILFQITMPFDEYGEDVNDLAYRAARRMAEMAGLKKYD